MEPHPSAREQLQRLYRSILLGSKNGIRVLDLAPASSTGADIKINLRAVELGPDARYEALSYTWGTRISERTISVNGEYRLPATQNLYNALRGLRYCFKTRTLWIDQICISQSDSEERGQQVALMGQIYANATCVNVWLGQPPTMTFPISLCPLSGYAFSTLKRSRRTHEEHFQHWRALGNAFLNHHRIIEKAIKSTERQWVTRVWIIQEFMLAKRVYLCCGRHSWLYNGSWLQSLRHLAAHFPLTNSVFKGQDARIFGGLSRLRYSMMYMDTFVQPRPSDPAHSAEPARSKNKGFYDTLTDLIGEQQATDPRDFVYSLLGLIGNDEARMVKPDYERPCWDPYARATHASIIVRKDYNILEFVKVDERQEDADLPSWVVDFSLRHVGWPLVSHIPHARLDFKLPRLEESSGLLVMPARRVGRIAETRKMVFVREAVYNVKRIGDLVLDAAMRFSTLTASGRLLNLHRALGFDFTGDNPAPRSASDLEIHPEADQDSGQRKSVMHEVEPTKTQDQDHHTSAETAAGGTILACHFNVWSDLIGLNPLVWSKTDAQSTLHHLNDLLENAVSKWRKDLMVFATSDGVIGYGPTAIHDGDIIVQVNSDRPFVVLRSDGDKYKFRGHVWMHGLMNQDIINRWTSLGMEDEEFIVS